MAGFGIFVDGKVQAHAGSEDEVRAWLERYRAEHADDDPDAAHVQVLEQKGRLAWLTGGRLVSPDRFHH